MSVDRPDGPDIWSKADANSPGDPDDATDRRVPLSEPLVPGQTLTLHVQFVTRLPFLIERMGWVEDFHAVAQWYPKLARLESDGTWRHFPYEPLAEFSADFGDYDLTIDVPERTKLAAPGARATVRRDRGRLITRFQLNSAHDFAFFAWDRFVESTRTVDGIQVHLYAPPGHSRSVAEELDTVEFGVPYFQKMFGEYPYKQLIVVHPPDAGAAAGGMEYPGLIVTGGPWYLPWTGFRSLQGVTLHELAHQWFYGVIANDEARFPVLDEGLATWAELTGLRGLFRQGSAFSGFGVTVSADATMSAISTIDSVAGPLARPASDFESFAAMAATVYAKTATLLDTLSSVYGRAKLWRAIHRYATTERFSHPTPYSLIDAIEAEMGPAAAKNLRTALFSNGWVDSSVLRLEARKEGEHRWVSSVGLRRRGTLSFPVSVSLSLHSGKVMYRVWPAEISDLSFDVADDSPVDSVTIDPENKVAIESNRLNDTRWRVTPPLPSALLDRLIYVADWLLSAVMP